ncbi:MAG: hypothetical protein HKO07_05400 [Pseudomonadales bacterium]|nr:hypothetical protein [Pseudomonadales bacterium]
MNYLKATYVALAGCFVTLALAPFEVWPLALLGGALLYHATHRENPGTAFRYIFLFGLALFTSGASWVYVSIHEFGFVAKPLSILLTALFCVTLALINTAGWLPYIIFRKAQPPATAPNSPSHLLLFASSGLFSECLRGWVFSGFPWLYLGYSQSQAPLAGWAPSAACT